MSSLVDEILREADERNNAWSRVTALAETGFVRWLVTNEPAEALARVARESPRWEAGRFDIQAYALSNARATLKLYEGDVEASFEEVEANAREMLGNTLVTIQTGEAGKQVSRLYVTDGVDIARE